jgi:hypothetical protein
MEACFAVESSDDCTRYAFRFDDFLRGWHVRPWNRVEIAALEVVLSAVLPSSVSPAASGAPGGILPARNVRPRFQPALLSCHSGLVPCPLQRYIKIPCLLCRCSERPFPGCTSEVRQRKPKPERVGFEP